ncbi:MAG: oligopeptide transporter, OPT family [Candidatus Zixiibacteriota bacterium]|nr:MAG: oligopeptide transporter, OPT family [candidate division Zixibacteria bacterium]
MASDNIRTTGNNSSGQSSEDFQPYVKPSESLAEFSLKAAVLGIIFGILFGAANAYLGLLAGLTVSTSIPVAVMTVGFFRLTRWFFGSSTILEANMSQTVGSASSSLASGVIFTIPALFLWGMNPSIFQIAGLAALGGVLGILFMIPLRRLLIKDEHGKLPYPEGTACAKVLVAADTGGAGAGNVFLGLVIGLVYKFFIGFAYLWKGKAYFYLPLVKKAQLGVTATPALLGVGYILGYRVASIMVSGSLISWVVLIPLIAYVGEHLNVPLFPETISTVGDMSPSEIWNRYIRYIGAGAVAFGGIITIIRSTPTMIKSFRIGVEGIRNRLASASTDLAAKDAGLKRTDRDLSLKVVIIGVAVVIGAIALIPSILGGTTSLTMRLVAAPAIAIFGFLFVTVSSRIVGLVGVSSNPTSGMTIVTLLGVSMIFVYLGWTDAVGKVTALTVGTVVCVAASIAGDTSQDLKTGFIVGATPFRQQIGELMGAVTSALAVAASIVILNSAYQFGSTELPAPQATLMKTIIEGVLESGVPWGLVLVGVLLGAVFELCSLPSLPFAVGLYLPVSTMTPIFLGGCIRLFVEKKYRHDQHELDQRRERGILFSSGLIGGEGLMGVGIALWAFYYGAPTGWPIDWPVPFGEIVTLGIFALLGYVLFRRTKPLRRG